MNALTDLDLEDLTSIPGWDGALQIALGDLPFPEQRISLLDAWLPRAHQNLRFFDFVHYRFIRYLPVGHPVRSNWVTMALSIAADTHDFSLVESLLLTLKDRSLAHNNLMYIAKTLASDSKQMRRVL